MPNWYTIRNEKGKAPEIEIYGVIGDGGFFSESMSAKQFRREVRALNNEQIVNIHVDSPGGSLFDGLAIYNTIRSMKPRTVAHVDGRAASAATLPVVAADEAIIPPTGMMMIHDPTGAIAGTEEDMRGMADALAKAKESIITAYQEKTSICRDEIASMMSAKTWMTSSDAIDLGFADADGQDGDAAPNPNTDATDNFRIKAANREWSMWARDQAKLPEIKTEDKEVADQYSKSEVDALMAESDDKWKSKLDAAVLSATEAAKIEERTRIQDIDDMSMAGHESVVAEAKKDGTLTAKDVAVMIVAAEKKLRNSAGAALRADEIALPAVAPQASGEQQSKDPIRAQWDSSEAIRDEFLEFEDFECFVKAGEKLPPHLFIQ